MMNGARRFLGLGLGLVIAMSGCNMMSNMTNNTGQAKETKKVASSMQETYEKLGQGKAEIDRTNGWLDQLSKGVDLPTNFKAYNGSVKALQTAAEAAKKEGAEMREKRDEYLERWQKEVEAIKNPTLQESVEQRRERVRARYEAITALGNEVRDGYAPYLQDLQDIQKALTIDLSPAGVESVKPAITKAKAEGEALGKKIDQLGIQINTLLGRISTTG